MSDQSGVEEQKVIDDHRQQTAPTKTDTQQQKALADFSKKNTGKTAMQVHVHSPFRDYYNGLAISLSAENATGPFDILPRHHNFISLLLPCEIVIRTVDEGERKIRISGGIIHVKANKVIVFLDV
jgi:hypothetical protein